MFLAPVWRRSAFWWLPPSMTLRRSSAPASGLAGVRVSGWPRKSARRPSVLLPRCYVTASALARPLWRLRRYQSSPLLECVERAGRINARRPPDFLETKPTTHLVDKILIMLRFLISRPERIPLQSYVRRASYRIPLQYVRRASYRGSETA